MNVTPVEIRHKCDEFPRSLRGLQPESVRAYLTTVAEGMERLVDENRMLAERVERLETENGHFRERERSISQALFMAEELREEARHQAQEEATLIRERAVADMEREHLRFMERMEDVKAELRRLHARRTQLLWSYRSFLTHELSNLESMDQTLRDRADAAGIEDAGPAVEPITGRTIVAEVAAEANAEA